MSTFIILKVVTAVIHIILNLSKHSVYTNLNFKLIQPVGIINFNINNDIGMKEFIIVIAHIMNYVIDIINSGHLWFYLSYKTTIFSSCVDGSIFQW